MAKARLMRRCFELWLLFSMLAGPALGLPLCLRFELQRTVTNDGQATAGEPQQVRVVLASDYLEFEDADGRVVHDFTTNRSHLVSGEDYVSRSLYADIGFRVAELNNRVQLLEKLRQTDVDALDQEEVRIEHLFGIDDETTDADIKKTEGATVAYTHRGQFLAEFSSQGRQLKAEESKAFVRFVRYYCGGHPDIMSDVQVRGVLPERFRVDVANLNELVSYRFSLLEVQDCDLAHPDFSGLRPTVLPPEPLGTLTALALQLSANAVPNGVAVLGQRAEQALSKGSKLEAALLFFEVLLMQGGPPSERLATQREAFMADPDAKLLFEALLVGGADPKKAASLFESLQDKAPSQAHVLKIFRAGMLLSLGERVKARDLYVEALTVNPAVAGAWKDLGDIYHSNYETDMAWLCWDVGRKLAPRHEMLQMVTKLEDVLRSNYPGFF